MSMIGELRQVPGSETRKLDEDAVSKLQDGDGLSLDKAWDGLRYLVDRFCQTNPIDGGEVIEHGDCGYGPAALLDPDEVRACAAELAAIDEADLRKAYDPSAMAAAEVYPSVWDRADERDRNLEWLITAFRKLCGFYEQAATRGCGVLFYLT